VEEKKR